MITDVIINLFNEVDPEVAIFVVGIIIAVIVAILLCKRENHD